MVMNEKKERDAGIATSIKVILMKSVNYRRLRRLCKKIEIGFLLYDF